MKKMNATRICKHLRVALRHSTFLVSEPLVSPSCKSTPKKNFRAIRLVSLAWVVVGLGGFCGTAGGSPTLDGADERARDWTLVSTNKDEHTELEALRSELEALRSELEGRASELEAKSGELDSRNAELDGKASELEAKSGELDS
ncbi:MAG: hypothetical protein DVB22_001129, partial [Verrucomicrobia bacterium]